MGSHRAEVRVLRAAAKRHGPFTRAEALGAGMSEGQVDRRLRTGRWTRVHPGVYVATGTPETWHLRVVAACLASGPRAVASHRTAAALLGLVEAQPSTVEVTVPHDAHHARHPGRIVHRARSLGDRDVRLVEGVPVTCAERTLVDLAGVLTLEDLEGVLDLALRRRITSTNRLRRYIADRRHGGRRGAGLLRRLLDDRERGVPEGTMERRFLRLLRRYRFPEPVRQHRVGRYRIDFAYPDQRVAIELDDYSGHSGVRRFRSDRRRQNALVLWGWRVLRFTWDDVTRRPEDVRRILLEAGVPVPGSRAAGSRK